MGNLDMSKMQLSVSVGGRVYAICDSVQFQQMVNWMMEIASNELVVKLRANGQENEYPKEEDVKALAKQKVEEKGFATLDSVLEMMTPEQRQQWKDSYRFTPITRRMSST